ncbi:hypothetical protein STAS_14555 [Striga asiatica]|uniref:Uncharacterized protein n=1 Tax=Striga asiatica TaxID=4170 RepID=A0A5A7PZW5_STRAF|nr:hypothetical protein STAS_14555 [Striga asiatica]
MKHDVPNFEIERFLPLSLEFDAIANTIKSFFPVGLWRRRAPRPWSFNIQATTEHNRGTMKRGLKWSDDEDGETSSSNDSSAHDSDAEDGNGSSKNLKVQSFSRNPRRSKTILGPQEKTTQQQKGGEKEEEEESYEERMKTISALASEERLLNVQTRSERSNANNLSFQQKEKRKRDLGQASRGKCYVEEEKGLLRKSGIYSGFDS